MLVIIREYYGFSVRFTTLSVQLTSMWYRYLECMLRTLLLQHTFRVLYLDTVAN